MTIAGVTRRGDLQGTFSLRKAVLKHPSFVADERGMEPVAPLDSSIVER